MKILLPLMVAVTLVQARPGGGGEEAVKDAEFGFAWNDPVLLPLGPTVPADDRKPDSGPMAPGFVEPESRVAVAGSSAAPVGWKDNEMGEGSATPPDDRKTGPLMASGSVVPRPRDTPARMDEVVPVRPDDGPWAYRGERPPVPMPAAGAVSPRSGGGGASMNPGAGSVGSVVPRPRDNPARMDGVVPVRPDDGPWAYRVGRPPVPMPAAGAVPPRLGGGGDSLGPGTARVQLEDGSWAYAIDGKIQETPVVMPAAPTVSPRLGGGGDSMAPGTGRVQLEDGSWAYAIDGKIQETPVAMPPVPPASPRLEGFGDRVGPGAGPVRLEDGPWAYGGGVAGPPEKPCVLVLKPVSGKRNLAELGANLILEDVIIEVKIKQAKILLGTGNGAITMAGIDVSS
ncbi:GlyPro2 [Hyposoter didymator ichnovirus]|nr:P40 protein [Hyposoter didymator ichnovirus]AAF08191.1 glycine and proline-rich protein P40 precursor [Hyposoter didymator ichnovirus]AIK25708.1 GlyPro2 [Hyposoter didymator ichnovirus]AIK25735.1 GlyPro2 [Hyposoter didymator ichnovirus]